MGTWIKGFAMNTGMRSSVKAKLWTVITGLELAWLLGLKKVILESDFAIVVVLITKEIVKIDMNYSMIMKAKSLFAREWKVQIVIIIVKPMQLQIG
jgi:L1 cell adhesion molecule like protein